MSNIVRTPTESPSSSILTVLRPSDSPTPSRRADSRRIAGSTWIRAGHQANFRRGIEQSRIWDHGDAYVALDSPDKPFWICDICDSAITIPPNQASSNMIRHLKKYHNILLKRTQSDREDEEGSEAVESIETPSIRQTPPIFSALMARINVDKFRNLLVQWIVQQQIPYSAVEQAQFRELLLELQPTLERYLVKSHNTISSWVDGEYKQAQAALKTQFNMALSRIHISFDIWTSPSALPILGICAHFLSPSLHLYHPLLGLRYIEGSHTGEAIAEIIERVVKEFEIQDKLGVYVADNASNCNSACNSLVRRLHEGEEDGSRRSRCLGHIINLAAQAFIYGKDNEAFINQAEFEEELSGRDQVAIAREQALWRSRGSFGRLHNIVKWMRASPQRRQEFEMVIKMVVSQAKARGE
jgi:hypothetical protein